MTYFERGIIDLVKSAITGDKISLSDDFDWEKAYRIAKKHQITPMLYYGIKNSEITPPPEIAANIEIGIFNHISTSTKQLYELDKIFKVFDDAKIQYMPLKGTLLKYMYNKPEMRSMGDADILIKVEQYDKIKPIISALGFNEISESNHEFIWNKPNALHLELHKMLIPSYNKDYYAYFKDGWHLAKKTDTTRYELSAEDNFIYLFTHYAKHYRDGGIGIRHLTDFYVFLNKNQNIDKTHIEKGLKKLHLLDFYKNSMKTLAVWFDGEKDTEITDFITAKIIGSGSYGTHDAHIISSAVKTSKTVENSNSVKSKKMIYMIFPKYSVMAGKYHILKKCPVLLPFAWVWRFVTAIFFRRDNIKIQKNDLKLMSADNISKYQQELNFVGLDFNFKE